MPEGLSLMYSGFLCLPQVLSWTRETFLWMRESFLWMRESLLWMRESFLWMRQVLSWIRQLTECRGRGNVVDTSSSLAPEASHVASTIENPVDTCRDVVDTSW